MKRMEMEVVGEAVNAAVVKLPWRRFPGLVIQGDSLSILGRHAERVVDAIAEARLEDAAERATELRDLLDGYRCAYEAAMKQAGLELPYPARK